MKEIRSPVTKSHLSSCYHIMFLTFTARGDRMKQAKADAQELVDSYRAEKQNLFNNQVLASGKF